MSDTYKISEETVLFPKNVHRQVMFQNTEQLNEYDIGDSTASTGFYRKTTERNSKKNGGVPPAQKPLPKVEIILKDLGNYGWERSFDHRSGKYVKKQVPVLSEAIHRTYGASPTNEPTNLLTNDLWFHDQELEFYGGTVASYRNLDGTYDPTHDWVDTRNFDGWPIVYEVLDEWGGNPTRPSDYPVSELDGRYVDEIAELTEESVKKLYAYTKAVPADLGIGLAESDKTFRTIVELCTRLFEFFRDLKRLRILKAIRDILPSNKEELANDYLAYRYGISPLINDVSGLITEVNEKLEGTFKYKAIGKAMRSYQYETGGVLRTADIIVKHRVIYGVDSELMSTLNRVGLTNPPGVAWELIPFSFIIDWFYPIGSWLSSLSAFDHLVVKGVHKSVLVTERVYCYEQFDAEVSPMYLQSPVDNVWVLKTVKFKREVLTSVPDLPRVSIKSPVSWIHAFNFLALLTQVISRSKQ